MSDKLEFNNNNNFGGNLGSRDSLNLLDLWGSSIAGNTRPGQNPNELNNLLTDGGQGSSPGSESECDHWQALSRYLLGNQQMSPRNDRTRPEINEGRVLDEIDSPGASLVPRERVNEPTRARIDQDRVFNSTNTEGEQENPEEVVKDQSLIRSVIDNSDGTIDLRLLRLDCSEPWPSARYYPPGFYPSGQRREIDEKRVNWPQQVDSPSFSFLDIPPIF
ncbi:MAG: hypothetical protein K2Z81_04405 [Cyanobacteria bacterium]|nr:hypothetical protein [Cyanobacteriota bacterium]